MIRYKLTGSWKVASTAKQVTQNVYYLITAYQSTILPSRSTDKHGSVLNCKSIFMVFVMLITLPKITFSIYSQISDIHNELLFIYLNFNFTQCNRLPCRLPYNSCWNLTEWNTEHIKKSFYTCDGFHENNWNRCFCRHRVVKAMFHTRHGRLYYNLIRYISVPNM